MANDIDLAKVFQVVAKNLAQNRDTLNQADSYNHDHGDNIVQVFQLVTKAVKAKKGADVSEQLAYASDYLSKNSKSGSGQAYAQGLAQAANQFKEKQLTPNNAMELINALLGGGQVQSEAKAESPVADLLGSLLSGKLQTQDQSPQQTPNTSDLLNMGMNLGMNFLQAKQQGRSNKEALIESIVASSQIGQTPHRAQSATIIASTLVNLLSSKAK